MFNDKLLALTKTKVPTILGYDTQTGSYVIGEEARSKSLRGEGQTSVFNFKPTFGLGDKDFSNPKSKAFWFHYPLDAAAGGKSKAHVETFTAKEAAVHFLRTLFAQVDLPEKIIVGEPGVRERSWRDNFRRHVREVLNELGHSAPEFFPEPFAVFHYYRHVSKQLPIGKGPEAVLILDIGGGTFNSCIIRTTEKGLLAQGGATSVPLGMQADTCGGSLIDRELLRLLVEKARKKRVYWKDDPLLRLEKHRTSALLRVEDAKIRLSTDMSSRRGSSVTDDYSDLTVPLLFPKGEFHPDIEIAETLSGNDLRNVVRSMWRRHYGQLICDTVTEAKATLGNSKIPLDRIDKVLVAGGSSGLPFMKEEICAVLPALVDRSDVYIGSDIGEAVAYGIAWECKEQARTDPKLSVGRIAPCILNDLFLGFRLSRREPYLTPKVWFNGQPLKNSQLLAAPFETTPLTTDDIVLRYEVELPFNLPERLYYAFSAGPIRDGEDVVPINDCDDVFTVPDLKKPYKRFDLCLEVMRNGLVRPRFTFRGKGDADSKRGKEVICNEFFSDFQIREGHAYVGFDFGNSNSYLVRFASSQDDLPGSTDDVLTTEYPDFTLSGDVIERLRGLELRIEEARRAGHLEADRLTTHARNLALEVVFHSNKLEGSPLSRGETMDALTQDEGQAETTSQVEAKNMGMAYEWVLENFDACFERPEQFVRTVNSMVISRLKETAGQYRTEPVTIAGMDFTPPSGSVVPSLMQQLGNEMRTAGTDRSALEFAATLHTKLVWIHPFSDGNGRTARLLLNASLLALGLPVFIINYADRERYLYCLEESNRGDLSPLVEFFREGFEQQLARFESQISDEEEVAAPVSEDISASDIISESSAIEEVISELVAMDAVVLAPSSYAVPEASDEPASPLDAVMAEILSREESVRRAEYDAWRQSFFTIRTELGAISEAFNSKYGPLGFRVRLHHYDELSFEKYCEICVRHSATRTWFESLEMLGPRGCERLLFYFHSASDVLSYGRRVGGVSLYISRHDGSRFKRLDSEPITLREIGYAGGQLEFVKQGGTVSERGVRYNLEKLIAETLKYYFL